MTTAESLQLLSIRRASKVCSLMLLMLFIFQLPVVLASVNRMAGVYHDMMGNRPALPFVFWLSNLLCDEMPLVAVTLLLVLIGAIVITVKSKGGLFLYINCGFIFISWLFCQFLAFAAQKAIQIPMDMLSRSQQ